MRQRRVAHSGPLAIVRRDRGRYAIVDGRTGRPLVTVDTPAGRVAATYPIGKALERMAGLRQHPP